LNLNHTSAAVLHPLCLKGEGACGSVQVKFVGPMTRLPV
jgi:hypothetical protein